MLKLKVQLIYEIHRNNSNMFQNNGNINNKCFVFNWCQWGKGFDIKLCARRFTWVDPDFVSFLLCHFAAPITTPYISQRAVYMYL